MPVSRRTDYGHAKSPDARCTHAVYYGLTCDEYEAMRDRAEDRCEICRRLGRETPRGELVIDHFEGRDLFFVRGLLCDKCNALMQRHDGMQPWGPATRPFADKARAYHLRAFGNPSPEAMSRADEVIQAQAAYQRSRSEPPPTPAPGRLDDLLGDLYTWPERPASHDREKTP